MLKSKKPLYESDRERAEIQNCPKSIVGNILCIASIIGTILGYTYIRPGFVQTFFTL